MPGRRLTARQKLFVDKFCTTAHCNASEAARQIGITGKSASVMGTKWLAKVWVQRAVQARMQKREQAAEITNAEIDSILAGVARNPHHKDQVAAARELNKCRARHSVNHKLDATDDLKTLLASSWAK